MPTYEYSCRKCGHSFEQFHSIKASPLKVCPRCKKRSLERVIGAGGAILFKGSGFYQTDYRSSSYRKSAEAESKPGPCSESCGCASATPAQDTSSSGQKKKSSASGA